MNAQTLEQKNKWFFKKLANRYDHGLGGKFILKKIQKTVESAKVKSKSKVLDIGCGTGNLLFMLSKDETLELHGIDLNKDMLGVARKKLKNKAKIARGSAKNLLNLYKKNYFDYIFMSDAFHHMSNQEKVISDIKLILKKGGKLIIGDFSFGNTGNRIFHIVEPGNSGMHTADELKELFIKNGFKKIKQEKHGFVSIYIEGVK